MAAWYMQAQGHVAGTGPGGTSTKHALQLDYTKWAHNVVST